MNPAVAGTIIGAVLAVCWILFGFWWFLFVALFMLCGAAVGRVLSGQLDLSALADAFRGQRRS